MVFSVHRKVITFPVFVSGSAVIKDITSKDEQQFTVKRTANGLTFFPHVNVSAYVDDAEITWL